MEIGGTKIKIGDLLKFRDYTTDTNHYGLYLGPIYDNRASESHMPWGDIYVWSSHGEEEWISWQCEVVNADRGHGTS